MLGVILVSATVFSNHNVYAHTFSQDENALFLTLIHKLRAELQIVQSNISNNTKLAQQHADFAAELLNQNDPSANSTWSKEILERNRRVATELTSTLDSLKDTLKSKTSPIVSDIQTKVTKINGLLGEAISSRISKEIVNNPKTQALMVTNLANEIYNSYGKALGMSPATMRDMMMSMTGGSSNRSTGMSSNGSSMMSMANNNSSNSMTNNSMRKNTIVDITNYQTAQALAVQIQEAFNKDLKSIAPANATAGNEEVEKDITELKNTIDNTGPFMDIANLVHARIHPNLITVYSLQLK